MIKIVVVVFRTRGMIVCRWRKPYVDLTVLMLPEAGICLMAEGFNLNMILTTLMIAAQAGSDRWPVGTRMVRIIEAALDTKDYHNVQ